MKNLMKYDPATGVEKPYPSSPNEYREYHGKVAWLYNPYTGVQRNAMDVGSDILGLLLLDEEPKENAKTEEYTPLTKQKLFDGVVLSKLTGTPIAEIKKDSYGYWRKSTYDDAGRVLTYEDSGGFWHKTTYNEAGQVLTYEESGGFWYKFTYDHTGMEVAYKNSYSEGT